MNWSANQTNNAMSNSVSSVKERFSEYLTSEHHTSLLLKQRRNPTGHYLLAGRGWAPAQTTRVIGPLWFRKNFKRSRLWAAHLHQRICHLQESKFLSTPGPRHAGIRPECNPRSLTCLPKPTAKPTLERQRQRRVTCPPAPAYQEMFTEIAFAHLQPIGCLFLL